MSNYPGPRELVTGERGECEHGTPDDHPCAFCLQSQLAKEEEAHDSTGAELDLVRSHYKALRRAVLAYERNPTGYQFECLQAARKGLDNLAANKE